MKKILFTFRLLVSQMLTVVGQTVPERYDLNVKLFNESNDQYVCNTTLSMWMDDGQLVVKVNPYPGTQYGIIYIFSKEMDATLELVQTKEVNGVILSQKASGYQRIFVENSTDSSNNREFMYFYKRDAQGDAEYKPYYLELTEQQGYNFRAFCVLNNSNYHLFKMIRP